MTITTFATTKSQNKALRSMTNLWLLKTFGTDTKWDYTWTGHPDWRIIGNRGREIVVQCKGVSNYEIDGSNLRMAEFNITSRGKIYQSLAIITP